MVKLLLDEHGYQDEFQDGNRPMVAVAHTDIELSPPHFCVEFPGQSTSQSDSGSGPCLSYSLSHAHAIDCIPAQSYPTTGADTRCLRRPTEFQQAKILHILLVQPQYNFISTCICYTLIIPASTRIIYCDYTHAITLLTSLSQKMCCNYAV